MQEFLPGVDAYTHSLIRGGPPIVPNESVFDVARTKAVAAATTVISKLFKDDVRKQHFEQCKKLMLTKALRVVRRTALEDIAKNQYMQSWRLLEVFATTIRTNSPSNLRDVSDILICKEQALVDLCVRCTMLCVHCRKTNNEKRAGSWPTDEYVVLATLYLLREGVQHEGLMIIPEDDFSFSYMPDMSSIERYGFKKSKLTIAMRFVKESVNIGVQLLPLHDLRILP